MPNIPPMVTHMSQSQQLYQSTASGGGGPTYSGVTTITAGAGITINPPSGVGNVLISNGGVSSLVAGTNITLSPPSGTGAVTVSAVAGASAFATGMILLFTGATAPAGWAFCTGASGTPDLRDKFVLSSGVVYTAGTSGGASSVTLAVGNLPAHQHGLTNGTASVATSCLTVAGGGGGTGIVNNQISRPSDEAVNSASSTISGQTDSVGLATPFGILPPYYALAYIMKL
jgi:microcystin-dependent protein